MSEWINVNDRLPETEIECFVAVLNGKSLDTHKKLAVWNGDEWIDIDGDAVEHVKMWIVAPSVKLPGIINKLAACIRNDKCEKVDCCYFTAQKEIEALLEYIKNEEEKQ